ncbi:hypothetical protein [Aurantiacibacter gilvus]|uniref:Uncharacterized protein n=1 Tax=Aurantiacibacter gilvus TaxID=3139141 RepID=A0ABU9IG22_9SPHN
MRRHRPPFFHPAVPRSRRDGWTVERQCLFLGHLYLTGSVAGAAAAAGMSRMSAYRLRRRPDAQGFAHAWDVVLAPPGSDKRTTPATDWRKVTLEQLQQRVATGLVAPLVHAGRVCAIRHKPDNSALLRLLRRYDALCPPPPGEDGGA